MPYLLKEDIRQVHLEITNRCNAACPQCSRNVYGAFENPMIKQAQELRIDEIDSIFSDEFCRQLDLVMFCGTVGDPITSASTLPAVRILKSRGVKGIWIHTNGSAQNESWWLEMAALLKDPGDRMVFSVDGLEDTNHLYRRGTSWEKIHKNMRDYTKAGGNARWDYLVFRHNEHQVDEARALAKSLGFLEFRMRTTSRFAKPARGTVAAPQPVYAKENVNYSDRWEAISQIERGERTPDYFLEQPLNPRYWNKSTTEKLPALIEKYGSFLAYLEQTKISCIYKNFFHRIYIGSDATIWPCSYLYGDLQVWQKHHGYREDLQKNVLEKYEQNFNSLRSHSLDEILQHRWFAAELGESWENDTKSPQSPRLKKCARTCGDGYNPILSQTKDFHLQKKESAHGN